MPTDPDLLAQGCAEMMWQGDMASQKLGLVIDDVSPGKAQLSLTVSGNMVNGHDMAHGGYIFLLADATFAYACNSRNSYAVAQNCNVTFLKPGRRGDRLTARAAERQLSGRTGIYDVEVTNQDGTTIAEFRGLSRIVPGQYFPDGKEQDQAAKGTAQTAQ